MSNALFTNLTPSEQASLAGGGFIFVKTGNANGGDGGNGGRGGDAYAKGGKTKGFFNVGNGNAVAVGGNGGDGGAGGNGGNTGIFKGS